MTRQEKKYRADSFDYALHFFAERSVPQIQTSTTYHFYGQQGGNNVTKLVQYADKQEIHILEESGGIFSLVETIPVDTVNDGLEWLRSHGYEHVDEVKMQSWSFEYRGGLVRLYLIDDWLHSIILSHEYGQIQTVEKELGLKAEDVIVEPYNKYLATAGRLKSRKL